MAVETGVFADAIERFLSEGWETHHSLSLDAWGKLLTDNMQEAVHDHMGRSGKALADP